VLSQVYRAVRRRQAGLVKGDVLVSVDGFTVTDSNALRYPGGDAPSWRVRRRSVIGATGRCVDASIRIALPPDAGREAGCHRWSEPNARCARRQPHAGRSADEMQMDMMARGVRGDGRCREFAGAPVRVPRGGHRSP
jgi:hypothetical protein